MAKPSIPQGMRDFGPETVRKRNYIFSIIRNTFELYGFQPLETPAMEQLETLMGKYGDEGDKLMFKVLNNGLNDPKNVEKSRIAFDQVLTGKSDKNLTERALKYDLTIPFARYVAMNAGLLSFPFKRYQIQPVWRADRPQKGRYREFYQCDADIVGSRSLLNELELALIYTEVLSKLKLNGFRVLVNNRKVLKGIIEVCGLEEWEKKVLVIIDKTDKIGIEGVRTEMQNEAIPTDKVHRLIKIYSYDGDNLAKINFLRDLFGESVEGMAGLDELEQLILDFATFNPESAALQIDLTLARGLDYYTGIIFEARAPGQVKIGSIGGGGRYDDLTGLFGVPDIPGVGISFGVDRIYDVLEELNLFPTDVHKGTNVLFYNLGKEESRLAFRLMQNLRIAGISCEIYHEEAKFDKQFKYAERKKIPFAVIIGEQELASETVIIRDLGRREQEVLGTEGFASGAKAFMAPRL
ncbi:MAG: histidine--tRNA ligase [Chitinophagaceae bacterium]